MKIAYSHITVDWVSVSGAQALALGVDRPERICLAAPFTRMKMTAIIDP